MSKNVFFLFLKILIFTDFRALFRFFSLCNLSNQLFVNKLQVTIFDLGTSSFDKGTLRT